MRAPVIALAAVCAAAAVSVIFVFQKKESVSPAASSKANTIRSHPTSTRKSVDTISSKESSTHQAQKQIQPQYIQPSLVYIKPPVQQTILVAGKEDTVVRFLQGTELRINPSNFISEKTGQPVAGPVRLQVSEHYSIEDILLNDLSTTTQNGLLETNGMINIQAFAANGESCKLRKNGTIEIYFPIKNDKPGMQLFTGSRNNLGNIIWQPVAISIENKPVQKRNNGDTNQVTGAYDSILPKDVVIDTSINALPQFVQGLTGIEKNINNIRNHFPFLRDNAVVVMDFNISSSGKVCWVQEYRSSSEMYSVALKEALMSMPQWKPGIVKGKPKMMTMRMVVSFSAANPRLMKFWSCVKSPMQINRWMYDYGVDYTSGCYSGAQENDRRLSNYVLTSTSLGWINCDRFYNTPKPKIEMYVQETVSESTSIKMIFHNYRSVLNAGCTENGNFVFANVPLGEPVTLIALKGDKSHLQMALKKLTVSKQPVEKLTYVDITVDGIKKVMEQLDKSPGSVAAN